MQSRKIKLFSLVMIVSAFALQLFGIAFQPLARPAYAKAMAPPPPPTVQPDFNGDGFVDLVVGVPEEEVESPDGFEISNAGLVNVIYGKASGLAATDDVMLHQDSEIAGFQINGGAEDGDAFGATLATGNFNGDAYTDLAIGVPDEDVSVPGNNSEFSDAGAVHILYGSPDGLKADNDQLWYQGKDGLAGTPQHHDRFGAALAVGDFNGDGKDDLAIGIPGEDVTGVNAAGAVNILYGTGNEGLSATNNQLWSQESQDIEGVSQTDDHFGAALAAGDFNNDGRDDLAIGVPNESVSGQTDAGAVNVLYASGNGSGLSALGDQIWHQDSSPGGIQVLNAAEPGDLFGSALAAGDFSGDGRDDLAIGVPGESVNGNAWAGAVNVLYAFGTKLVANGNQFWHQDAGLENSAAVNDRFGEALAAGDFNDDGRSDLAIGVPGETVNGQTQAGAVNVVYAAANVGLSATNNKLWHQDNNVANVQVAGEAQAGDSFGAALATGDFNNDGRDDLAIGVSREDVEGMGDAGAINILFGTAAVTGIAATGNQMWHQNSAPGGVPVAGLAEASDRFGSALGGR